MPVSRNDLEKMALGDFRGQPSCIGSRMAEELIHLQDDHAKLINTFNRALFKIVELTGIVCGYDDIEFFPDLFKSLLDIPSEKDVDDIRKHYLLPEGFQFFKDSQDPDRVSFLTVFLACNILFKEHLE